MSLLKEPHRQGILHVQNGRATIPETRLPKHSKNTGQVFCYVKHDEVAFLEVISVIGSHVCFLTI